MAEEPFDHTNIEVIIQALQELVSQLNQILLNMRREIGQKGPSKNFPIPPPPPPAPPMEEMANMSFHLFGHSRTTEVNLKFFYPLPLRMTQISSVGEV